MNPFELQTHLNRLGFGPIAVDGDAGAKTLAAAERIIRSLAVNPASWSNTRRLVGAEQAIMRDAGLYTGKVDGLAGPATAYARVKWQAGAWRDTLMDPVAADERMPEPVKTAWPRQADCLKFYGKVGENQTMLHLPFSMRLAWDARQEVRKFSIHEKVHDSAARCFARVLEAYGEEEIRRLRLDLFGGCLNVRKMRGGSAWSMHSWGIAIDFDPAHNALNMGRDKASLARPDYEAFWKIWTEEGWLSLGKARNFDWMHVQAARL